VANTGIARRGGAGFVVVLLLILMALARAQQPAMPVVGFVNSGS